MWRSLLWTAVLAALLGGAPALADHDDDWEERYHEAHKKKGKGKGREDRGFYLYYYIPRELPPPVPCECPAARPAQPAPHSHGGSPDAFPRESRADHARAGQRQRQILEAELATEEQLLALARRELAERQGALAGEDGPSAERLRAFLENVELHERNVAALRRELDIAKR